MRGQMEREKEVEIGRKDSWGEREREREEWRETSGWGRVQTAHTLNKFTVWYRFDILKYYLKWYTDMSKLSSSESASGFTQKRNMTQNKDISAITKSALLSLS